MGARGWWKVFITASGREIQMKIETVSEEFFRFIERLGSMVRRVIDTRTGEQVTVRFFRDWVERRELEGLPRVLTELELLNHPGVVHTKGVQFSSGRLRRSGIWWN